MSKIANERVNPQTAAVEFPGRGSEKPNHIHSPTPAFS